MQVSGALHRRMHHNRGKILLFCVHGPARELIEPDVTESKNVILGLYVCAPLTDVPQFRLGLPVIRGVEISPDP